MMGGVSDYKDENQRIYNSPADGTENTHDHAGRRHFLALKILRMLHAVTGDCREYDSDYSENNAKTKRRQGRIPRTMLVIAKPW